MLERLAVPVRRLVLYGVLVCMPLWPLVTVVYVIFHTRILVVQCVIDFVLGWVTSAHFEPTYKRIVDG